jgi:lipopolysaccharide biosynthesis protein
VSDLRTLPVPRGSQVFEPCDVRLRRRGQSTRLTLILRAVRSIAFYLPQFHPIPENDAWWGMGFTEWINVAKARPRFRGHYQPHLPADLGFYDLRVPDTRSLQASMAAAYGIYGFCYYHYWFEGKRLLERPFAEVLDSGEPEFPFMLCWANENWTRRWDGRDQEVLMPQRYSREDARRHIKWLLNAFSDRRYIKVDGRPVFLVYFVYDLPDPAATSRLWRAEAKSFGFPDLYLCCVEAKGRVGLDPRTIGFDAAVQFAPAFGRSYTRKQPPKAGRALRRIARPNSGYRWNLVFSYDEMVALDLQDPAPPYLSFPCVTPSWDNSARRDPLAFIMHGSTPDKYGAWLTSTISRFRPPTPDEDFVFTNAWNEWAEGNHLEPDQRWGRQYLEAHREAVRNQPGV